MWRRRALLQSEVSRHISHKATNAAEEATVVTSVLWRRRALLESEARQKATTITTAAAASQSSQKTTKEAATVASSRIATSGCGITTSCGITAGGITTSELTEQAT